MQTSAGAIQVRLFGEDREGLTGREAKEADLLYGRPLDLKFRGRAVPEKRAANACDLVKLFAARSGQPTQCFERSGSPSEALKRVVGALTTHDDVPFKQWLAMVPKVLAAPWWEGAPSIGVVFGPKVVEANLAMPAGTKRPGKYDRAGKVVVLDAAAFCRRCSATITNYQSNNQSGLCDPCYAAHEASQLGATA